MPVELIVNLGLQAHSSMYVATIHGIKALIVGMCSGNSIHVLNGSFFDDLFQRIRVLMSKLDPCARMFTRVTK